MMGTAYDCWFLVNQPYHPAQGIPLYVEYRKLNNPMIEVIDLQGAGESSGISSQGIGTVMFNSVLQLLKQFYPPETPVYGSLSYAGDPEDPELANQCHLRRIHFWSRFGFVPEDPSDRTTKIRAKLGDLNLIEEGLLFEKYPRFIPLDRFREVEPGMNYKAWEVQELANAD